LLTAIFFSGQQQLSNKEINTRGISSEITFYNWQKNNNNENFYVVVLLIKVQTGENGFLFRI